MQLATQKLKKCSLDSVTGLETKHCAESQDTEQNMWYCKTDSHETYREKPPCDWSNFSWHTRPAVLPELLCNSTEQHTNKYRDRQHIQQAVTNNNQVSTLSKCVALLPRSVLGLASSCLNLSSRLFSRTVMGGAPDAFWSEMRATSGMMGRTGRDCCFCSVERTVEGHTRQIWKCNNIAIQTLWRLYKVFFANKEEAQ